MTFSLVCSWALSSYESQQPPDSKTIMLCWKMVDCHVLFGSKLLLPVRVRWSVCHHEEERNLRRGFCSDWGLRRRAEWCCFENNVWAHFPGLRLITRSLLIYRRQNVFGLLAFISVTMVPAYYNQLPLKNNADYSWLRTSDWWMLIWECDYSWSITAVWTEPLWTVLSKPESSQHVLQTVGINVYLHVQTSHFDIQHFTQSARMSHYTHKV